MARLKVPRPGSCGLVDMPAPKPGRGGARKGAGRPPSGKPYKTRHTVTLDPDTLAALLKISPNLSEAIRILATAPRE